MSDYDAPLSTYTEGDRIELHPGTDQWMQGDRYGAVTSIGRKYLHIRMGRSGRILKAPVGRVRKVVN